MNKWLQSSLIVGVAMLAACSTTSNKSAQKAPPIRHTSAPAKLVRIAPEYRSDAPERYVVRRGDTLWGISAKFLKHPGRWKEIWHANPQIKNPNRIYPGDIISYITVGGQRKLQVSGSSSPARGKFTGHRTSDGRPIYKLSPTVQVEALAEPIPTVPKEVVYPFMTKNLILEPGFSEEYPYIVGQADGNFISLSGRSEVYARGDFFEVEDYDVFREAKAVTNPGTSELIGVEAVYVGRLQMTKPANGDGIATFRQTDSVNPLYPKDVLIPSEAVKYGGELNFLPRLADVDESAIVIRPVGAYNSRTGSQFSTLLINIGKNDGAVEGDVFKIVRGAKQAGKGRNGEVFELPDYEIGIGMIYRTFDDSSYALVMNANDVIYPGDRLVTP